MAQRMRAVVCPRYGPPEVLRLDTLDVPVPRGPQIRIRNRATAVTSSDCFIRGLQLPAAYRALARLKVGLTGPRQAVLGMVSVGDVDAVGESVTRFAVDDPVYAFTMLRFGAYAEYVCVPEDAVVAIRPSGLDCEESAAIPYGGLLALHYLRRGEIQRCPRVLIYGASGAVGTAAVQLAKHLGAEWVTGVCSGANGELVRSLGADEVVDYTREDFAERPDRYDLVLDAVGKAARRHAATALAPGGRFVSVNQGAPTFTAQDLATLTDLAESGVLRPVIDRTYPLAEIVQAHRYVETRRKRGNVVVTLNES